MKINTYFGNILTYILKIIKNLLHNQIFLKRYINDNKNKRNKKIKN